MMLMMMGHQRFPSLLLLLLLEQPALVYPYNLATVGSLFVVMMMISFPKVKNVQNASVFMVLES